MRFFSILATIHDGVDRVEELIRSGKIKPVKAYLMENALETEAPQLIRAARRDRGIIPGYT